MLGILAPRPYIVYSSPARQWKTIIYGSPIDRTAQIRPGAPPRRAREITWEPYACRNIVIQYILRNSTRPINRSADLQIADSLRETTAAPVNGLWRERLYL